MIKGIARSLALALCLSFPLPGLALNERVVEHVDPIEVDPKLSLKDLIDLTLEKFPRAALVGAKSEEARALRRKGDSLFSGAPSISLRYQNDQAGDNAGLREAESELELPLWKWGQRAAHRTLAELADGDAAGFAGALRLEIGGLVREALWDLALEENRRLIARQVFDVSQRLVDTVRRRVELGDLPRADLLLAQSDHLEKKSALAQAEAELMHARKRYSTLTQIVRIPADYSERQSALDKIADQHPALAGAQARVVRLQADLGAVSAIGSGQPSLTLAGKSERGRRSEEDIESVSIKLAVPFGGGAHIAPAIAAKNLELTQAMAERNALYRELERVLHEAEHNLEVDKVELAIADERKELAEQYLRMSRAGFESGEIKLIDLLKIQASAQAAVRDANERVIMVQRDIARYNQAVGELP